MNYSSENHPKNTKQFWITHDRSLSMGDDTLAADLTHDLYRGMPAWFNQFFSYFQYAAVERLFRYVEIPENSRALDLGCGTGRWCEWLVRQGIRPTGFDIGLQAVSLAKRRLREANFGCTYLPYIPLASQSFDLATSIMVLQHLQYEDQAIALNEIKRVLKPGGYFLACEMVDTGDQAAHIFSHAGREWQTMITQAGFEMIGVSASEYLPFIKTYHWLTKIRKSQNTAGVMQVGSQVNRSPIMSLLLRTIMIIAYPFEWLAAAILPPSWARLNVFLARKR